jgi:NAD(P)H-hydrate repair Nnr-like enzyme with NAD(P)H-hydrate dehydratase domain
MVVGTIPFEPGVLIQGRVSCEGRSLCVGDVELPGCQGTAAMLLAACAVTTHFGTEPPYAVLGGDIGRGEGTRAVYDALPAAVAAMKPAVLEFHYLQPTMAYMRRALAQIAPASEGGPLLVADAGGMYAARAAGLGARFELMTPDVGEVGFLADETVTHPAYVRHYLLGVNGFDPLALAQRAQGGLAARVLLVKGSTDHIVEEGRLVATVSTPCVPELEAIGGTGDTLAGLCSALMATGMATAEAAHLAARVNRIGGALLGARPDHGPADLAAHFPAALGEIAV